MHGLGRIENGEFKSVRKLIQCLNSDTTLQQIIIINI